MADDGTHVFIGDCLGLDVTEFDANTGNWIRTIWLPDSGTTNGLALAGGHLWVSAFLPDSVFEYDEDDGTLIRTLQGGAYGLDMPGAVAADNEHVWVSNPANNSVTEILASDGGLVRSIPFNEPGGIMSDGADIWVSSQSETVIELNATTGSVVRNFNVGSSYAGSDMIYGLPTILAHGYLFTVASSDSVAIYNGDNGRLSSTISGQGYGFDHPSAFALDGAHLWTANWGSQGNSGSVTELNIG